MGSQSQWSPLFSCSLPNANQATCCCSLNTTQYVADTLAPPSSSWNHLLGLLPFLPTQRNGFWSRFSVDALLQHNVSDFRPQVRSGAVSRVMGMSGQETGSCCSCTGKHKCLMGFFSISCSSLAKFDQIRLTNAIRQRDINANRHLDTSEKKALNWGSQSYRAVTDTEQFKLHQLSLAFALKQVRFIHIDIRKVIFHWRHCWIFPICWWYCGVFNIQSNSKTWHPNCA